MACKISTFIERDYCKKSLFFFVCTNLHWIALECRTNSRYDWTLGKRERDSESKLRTSTASSTEKMKLLVDMPKIDTIFVSFFFRFLPEKTTFENSRDTRIPKRHDSIITAHYPPLSSVCKHFMDWLLSRFFQNDYTSWHDWE